jgi:Phage T4 tail fibre
MKTQNTIIALALFITAFTFGQNTFPTTGNVGIGTTSPSSKLEILEATDSKPAGVLAPTKSVIKLSRAGTPNYSYPENAEFRIGHGGPNVYGSKLDLYINGSANTNAIPDQHVMTWNYDGNVGIGTTTPSAKLDVSVALPTQATYNSQIWSANNADYNLRLNTIWNNDGVNQEFVQRFNGTDYKSLAFYWGNIGIGTSRPTEKLEIAGNAKVNGNLSVGKDTEIATISGPTNSGAIQIKSHSGLGGATNRYLRLGWKDGLNNFSPALSINDDLNVGIGTTTPSAKLHVNNGDNSYGAILATSTGNPFALYTKTLVVQPGDVESFRLGMKYDLNENNGFISFYRGQSSDGGFLGFSTNGQERMRLDRAGNVGIGTTAPDAKLTVNGQIHTKEVRIDILQPMTVPDYVFANDYKLKTLNEVDQYVKANSHLPEIPSAAAMAQNGMLVSEMNLSLLKKIEELTLYLIEQNKQIEILKTEVKELKK